MKKVLKEYSSLNIEDYRKIRGYCLSNLMRSAHKIPSYPGVYVWRYWPSIPSLDSEKLTLFINELQDKFPKQLEVLRNSRVEVSVKRTPFGNGDDGRLLGIKSQSKIDRIYQLLDSDEDTRQLLAHTLEVLIASFPPIYIGKADNLKIRLMKHFDSGTDVLKNLDGAGISKNDVYISFIKDELSDDISDITTGIEEILQRLTNPVLTKRYG